MLLTSLENTINLVLHMEKLIFRKVELFFYDHMVNKQPNQFQSQILRFEVSYSFCSIIQQLPIITSFWLLPTVILFGLLQISFCFLLYPGVFLFNRCPGPFYLFENKFYPFSKIFLQQIYFGVMFISELPQFCSTLVLQKFFSAIDFFSVYSHYLEFNLWKFVCLIKIIFV